MATELDLEDFLSHNSGGSRATNWRKRDPSQIDMLLHPGSKILSVWKHSIPRLVEREEDGRKEMHVWGGDWVCHDHEKVVSEQYRRDKKTNLRETPAEKCGMCKFNDWIAMQVFLGKIHWLEPIFEFRGDDKKEDRILTASGIVGYPSELTETQRVEMKRAGISPRDGWLESLMAKSKYLFVGIDADDPKKVIICEEGGGLGSAVKRVIKNQVNVRGAKEGHPLLNPYIIRWLYDEKAKKIQDKYDAVAVTDRKLTDEMLATLKEPVPRDIEESLRKMTRVGDHDEVRARLEKHCVFKGSIPWDDLFPVDGRASTSTDESFDYGAKGGKPPTRPDKAPEQPKAPDPKATKPEAEEPPRRRRAAEPPPKDTGPTMPKWPEGTVMVDCEKCGAPNGETDPVCWKCGTKYNVEDDDAADKAAPQTTVAPEPKKKVDW